VRGVLSNLADTTGVTGANLYRLLSVKFKIPDQTMGISPKAFERGLLSLCLDRRISLPAALEATPRAPPVADTFHPWHQHPLIASDRRTGWRCDGRRLPGGCRGTGGGNGERHRCNGCDFDLCGPCWAAGRAEHAAAHKSCAGWRATVGALVSALPRATARALGDDLSALLSQAGIDPSAVVPSLCRSLPLLEWPVVNQEADASAISVLGVLRLGLFGLPESS